MIRRVKVKEEKLLREGHGCNEMTHIDVRVGGEPGFVKENSKKSMQEECCGNKSMFNVVKMSG